ncbi:hypothetical protein JAAARDRAFT_38183 [Jaapia argillacea MUCL 33604]|uniref:Mitochondrial outer membrane protein IML2 n=1 Tax=Jaapia argillacea MUCL 33604 TaxID=933084 RepID=A0A067PHY7_9AGAM|nr:hypothetical protein JAAARDRAFT_38183 [Jaapia argillacea MUCL 33604]
MADDTAATLLGATEGFDHLFANRIREAKETFASNDSPFHTFGLGICAFLEAALGMETGLMLEATRCLTLSESGAKKQMKAARYSSTTTGRFVPGLEWELLHADAVILLGLTHALSESYMGYAQCLYALNSAHSKFSKLYKQVFPTGLDSFATPATTPLPSPGASTSSLLSSSSASSQLTTVPPSSSPSISTSSSSRGFFGRWTGGGGSNLAVPTPATNGTRALGRKASAMSLRVGKEGPVDELIISGTAFGFGLFNLVLSLLPAKVKGLVGFFGYNHDRKLALQALAVSAAKKDVHAVFAGLSLMTYHGVVLLLSGYQADEAHIIKQYRAIVDNVSERYPTGSLWILNHAKILRMSGDAEGAIKVLQDGLLPDRPHLFLQADALLIFELAWTLLSQRRYKEAADMFLRITEMNTWSHATYYVIAAGCHISLGNYAKAQEFLDYVPELINLRKVHGKELPTEVFIKKKLNFYKEKQRRRGGLDTEFAQCIKISPAEELAIFWNTHARIHKSVAEAHIREWTSLTPPITISSPYYDPPTPTAQPPNPISDPSSPIEPKPLDLDTEDELAVRSLLLGITHRTTGDFMVSREFLEDAHRRCVSGKVEISTWIGGVAMFELAVLDLREVDHQERGLVREGSGKEGVELKVESKEGREGKEVWREVLRVAGEKLDKALALAGKEVDLSSRLDSRIAMLRDEIALKREMLGL